MQATLIQVCDLPAEFDGVDAVVYNANQEKKWAGQLRQIAPGYWTCGFYGLFPDDWVEVV